MKQIGKIVFVIACVTAFAVFIRLMVYGVSEDFGWGFLAGALSFGLVVGIGSHVEMKDQLAKQRAELLRDL